MYARGHSHWRESPSDEDLSKRDLEMEAWEQEVSSVGQIIRALAKHKGTPIPWSLVVDAITDGLEKRIFEIIDGSPAWPCTADKADQIGLQVSRAPVTIDLAEIAPELDFRFRITITAEGEAPSNEVLNQINEILGKVTEKLTFEVSP